MSIKAQIERLQQLQKLSDAWALVASKVDQWYLESTGEALPEEVSKALKNVCSSQMAALDASAAGINPQQRLEGQFEERPEPAQKPKPRNEHVVDAMPDNTLKDPLKFITKYKTWVGKKVIALDGHGNKVYAEVVGAAFPNLLIKTDSGMKLPANPETLTLET